MNCKVCYKNEPKYFFRCLISNKSSTDVFVCEECFQKISQGDEVLGMIGEDMIIKGIEEGQHLNPITQSEAELRCPICETSLNEIGKTGRFGCEKCYEVFSDLIAVADVQIDDREKKLKESIGDKAQVSVETGKVRVLENRMQQAIKMEDYEAAAKIRDLISKIKEEKPEDGKTFK